MMLSITWFDKDFYDRVRFSTAATHCTLSCSGGQYQITVTVIHYVLQQTRELIVQQHRPLTQLTAAAAAAAFKQSVNRLMIILRCTQYSTLGHVTHRTRCFRQQLISKSVLQPCVKCVFTAIVPCGNICTPYNKSSAIAEMAAQCCTARIFVFE